MRVLDARQGSPIAREALLETEIDGRTVVFDLMDGYFYNDPAAVQALFSRADVVFKRSFSAEKNRQFPGDISAKLRPLGLNYYVTCPGSPLDAERSAKSRLKQWALSTRCYPQDFEARLTRVRKKPRILFLTRLWDPEEPAVQQYPDLQAEWRQVNADRIELLHRLQSAFPAQFTGGVSDNTCARRQCPELIVPDMLTGKRAYLHRMQHTEICVASTGLHGSTGWKLAEYVAAGRAIVTEPLRYTLPGGFEEGKNYKTYTSPAQCEEQLRQLLADPAAILAWRSTMRTTIRCGCGRNSRCGRLCGSWKQGSCKGEKRGMEEQKRHSGFETMRILSMVMIILMHGIGHGGLGSAVPQGSAAFWIYWLLFILARVSTNCFVMLSGYYLSERKGPVHVGRLFRIGAQVWFYSMLTFCVAVKAGAVPLSAVNLLRALLPLTSNDYWFASAYFLMYLSVPVLNAVVQSLDRRQYKTLLLVALLLQSVWGTLFYWATDVTFVNNGYSFIWFYILYFIAAYFRKYRVTVPSGLCLLAYLAASAAGLFNRMLALRVENALHLNGFVNTVNGYQALATVIASAAMFLLFQNIHIRSDYWRRWVFRLAPLSFGVYLLHDSDFTRVLLWRLVDLPRFGGALLPSLAYLTGAVLLIAVVGYAVDAVYQRLYRLLRLPALETKLDALTACILQRIVGSEET